jgi:hypothetical protein
MYGLELRIGSVRGLVDAVTYRSLLEDVRALLREIERTPQAWGVRHRSDYHGLTLRFEPFLPVADPAVVRNLVSAVVDGVHRLDEEAAIPRDYTGEAVESLRKAAARRGTGGVESLALASMNGSVLDEAVITDAVANHAAQSIAPAARDRGGVEGILDTLSGGAQASVSKRSVVLVDPFTRQRVRVRFAERDHLDVLANAWGQRVAVHGQVTYNKTGQPIRVDADELVLLPPLGDRRDLVKLINIAPGWTGGGTVKDVIEGMRHRA